MARQDLGGRENAGKKKGGVRGVASKTQRGNRRCKMKEK